MVCSEVKDVRHALNEYVDVIRDALGFHLSKIILYGSYARGDYNEDSDIDIMILSDLSDLELKEYFDLISDITFDFNLANDTYIMPVVKGEEHFNAWINDYPFYYNVNNEGVVLFEQHR